MTESQYEEQAKQRVALKDEIVAVKARLVVLKSEIQDTQRDIQRFSQYVNPEPFLGLAKKQAARLWAEQYTLTERLGRLNAQ